MVKHAFKAADIVPSTKEIIYTPNSRTGFFVWFLETRWHYVALTVLKPTMYTRLSENSL